MKKIKFLKAFLTLAVMVLSICSFWNLCIAGDENILAIEFLESNAVILWGLLFSSIASFILELFVLIKKNDDGI